MRNQILITATLVLLIAAVYLAIDLYRSGRKEVLSQFNTLQALLARQAAHEMASHFQESARDLLTLASLPSVQRHQWVQVEADLQAYYKRVEHLGPLSVSVVDGAGSIVFSTSPGAAPVDYSEWDFFKWAQRGENLSRIFVSTGVSMPTDQLGQLSHGRILLATPLVPTDMNSDPPPGSRMGPSLLLMILDLESTLTDHLSLWSPNNSHRFWIMDQDGTILLQSEHPEMAWQNIHRVKPECSQCHHSFDYAEKMLSGRSGIVDYQLKEQPRKLAAFAPLRFSNASWVMVINAPYDEVTAFAWGNFKKTLWLLVMITAGLSLASTVVYQSNLSKVRAEDEAKQWQEKLRLEERIRRDKEWRTAQLEALHQVSLGITAEMQSDVLYQTVTDQALKLFRGSAGVLFLHCPEQEVLEAVVTAGCPVTAMGTRLNKGEGLAGQVWETGRAMVVADHSHGEGATAGTETCPDGAMMGAPIQWRNAFMGVLHICSDQRGFFSREDVALLGLFATQAAIAIQNAALLEQASRDVAIKTTLLHDVNHRVKNNLMRLLEVIRLEQDEAKRPDSDLHATLGELANRLRGMDVVHSMLSSTQWSPLPLAKLVEEIVKAALSGSPIRQQIQVLVRVPDASICVVPEQATSLALIINELATNSVKYAFRNRQQGCLEICGRVEVVEKGRLWIRLEYRDDGPGWPEAVLKGQGRHVGLRLIQASIRSPLRGELTLRNDGGAVAELAFHLALPNSN